MVPWWTPIVQDIVSIIMVFCCIMTACGAVVDAKSTGHCYIATGNGVTCDLNGTTYDFWEFSHGLGVSRKH